MIPEPVREAKERAIPLNPRVGLPAMPLPSVIANPLPVTAIDRAVIVPLAVLTAIPVPIRFRLAAFPVIPSTKVD
jgi:hypothetical protein